MNLLIVKHRFEGDRNWQKLTCTQLSAIEHVAELMAQGVTQIEVAPATGAIQTIPGEVPLFR